MSTLFPRTSFPTKCSIGRLCQGVDIHCHCRKALHRELSPVPLSHRPVLPRPQRGRPSGLHSHPQHPRRRRCEPEPTCQGQRGLPVREVQPPPAAHHPFADGSPEGEGVQPGCRYRCAVRRRGFPYAEDGGGPRGAAGREERRAVLPGVRQGGGARRA